MATIDQLQPNSRLESLSQCLTPEAAQRIADYRVTEQDQQRVDELAAKASEGTLTPDEQREYQNLVDFGDIVGTLQALARMTLHKTV